ncbi:hypothetical protein ROV86_19280 [Stenotrophomonas pavanii]|uniref:hypothetical protein n=1 Tax=Stenotrophomonas pavanii TaxID=487698 RepID=UPI0028960371|nr:hypothetical protein [Stenotrophomonas pavanii]MDT3530245.1 hypothetical protein [Stenotrophomonas pavanii]
MADFSWLDEIPDDQWGSQGPGHFKSFGLKDFLSRSQAEESDLQQFNAWGAKRPRCYTAEVPVPLSANIAPIVLVVWPNL